jgi:D-alanine-D-alanine ligase
VAQSVLTQSSVIGEAFRPSSILPAMKTPPAFAARIAVLAGGDSPEREISLRSGRSVHDALIAKGYNARLLEIETLDDIVPGLNGADVVFSVLHGGSGEDGTVQLLLDVLGIPYAGSGPLACFRAMDKPRSRAAFALKRLRIPQGQAFPGGDPVPFLEGIAREMTFPLIVKPTNGGSTLGVSRVDTGDQLAAAVANLLDGGQTPLVEAFIPGRELTVGILREGDRHVALPVVEIVFPSALFDYQAKYEEGVARFVAPAELDEQTTRNVQEAALQAHEALECYGFSRVDLRLSPENEPFVLEVNALPGMTSMSDLPRSAAARGIPYEDLVERMLTTTWKEETP